jgi:UDP-N-acetylmuramate--alanine ligase
MLVGCGDQGAVAQLLERTCRKEERPETVISCGLGERNDWQAINIQANSLGGHDFEVLFPRQSPLAGQGLSIEQGWGTVRLPVPGLHNVQNALVALVVADWLGVERKTIVDALATFPGTKRRFEVRTPACGEAHIDSESLVVIDDYGHHPTEIRATLAAARACYGVRPLWAVFQPHTYSRLRALWTDFCRSFAVADHVVVLDVYASRETDAAGPSAASGLASALARDIVHEDARHIGDMQAAAEYIVAHAEPDAVLITLSAGDGNEVGTLVVESWTGGNLRASGGHQLSDRQKASGNRGMCGAQEVRVGE